MVVQDRQHLGDWHGLWELIQGHLHRSKKVPGSNLSLPTANVACLPIALEGTFPGRALAFSHHTNLSCILLPPKVFTMDDKLNFWTPGKSYYNKQETPSNILPSTLFSQHSAEFWFAITFLVTANNYGKLF